MLQKSSSIAAVTNNPDAALGDVMRSALQAFIEVAASGNLAIPVITAKALTPSGSAADGPRAAGHFHLGTELFLQIAGSTRFQFPQGERTLNAGQALVMPPKLMHEEWVCDGPDAAFANIVIYADPHTVTCHLAFQETLHKPGILHLEQCRHAEAARIQGWLSDAAMAPAWDTPATWEQQQRALVLTVLAAVRRLIDLPAIADNREPVLLAKLRVLVQNRLGDPGLSVRSLAQSLGCSADYLSHLYSHATGERLGRLIQRRRLTRASRLLKESDAAIKEIAWHCGFSGTSYFIRSFKAEFGQTPNQYRSHYASTGA